MEVPSSGVSHEVTVTDPNAVITGEQGESEQLASNPEYEEYLAHGSEVYRHAMLGVENSIPKNNRLGPAMSGLVYADPTNWHPCTTGVNAGMRINNVTVKYNGSLNVFRKFGEL